MALEIPQPILDQIAKIPEAQRMPRAVASISKIDRVLRTPHSRFESLPGCPFAPHDLDTPEPA